MNVTRRPIGAAHRLSLVTKIAFAVSMSSSGVAAAASDLGSAVAIVGVLGSLAGLLAMATGLASLLSGLPRSPETVRLVVEEEALVLEGQAAREVIPIAALRSALAVARRHPRTGTMRFLLELVLPNGDERAIGLSSLEEAEALAARLGFGPGGRRVVVDLATPGRRWLHLLYAYLAYQIGSFAMLPLAFGLAARGDSRTPSFAFAGAYLLLGVLVPLVYTVLRSFFAAPVVTVGRDGVVKTWRGRTKRVALRPGVMPHDDPALQLSAIGLDGDRRWALWRLVAARAGAPSVEVPPGTFERVGADLAAWRAHLDGAMREAGYRTAGLAPDVAARVLESPRATPEQRVGAALALRVAGEDPARIRIAASACADEALGEALEAIAEDAPEAQALVKRALRA